tara:strand:- start:683 stop:1585 length:903 start_codon:yes stop_codon:yes gene_type:complete
MRILGINISHNASICQLTDGKVDFYLEEDRFNKKKYFIPTREDCYFKSIEKYVKEKPDYVITASFDRSLDKWEDLFKEDEVVSEKIGEQLKQKVHFFKTNHHLYHAYTGFHLSNFDEAIVVVMDGGGAQLFPMYQEVESIYLMNKNDCSRKFLHATTDRFNNIYELNNKSERHFFDETTEYFLSGRKSCGMAFADMCTEMGYKNGGLDAGKLMGLASYPDQQKAQELQRQTKEYTIKLLNKAFSYSDCKNVVLSGGYALNCVNNYHYVKEFPEHNFFVDPIAHDGGTSMGAALWMYNEKK